TLPFVLIAATPAETSTLSLHDALPISVTGCSTCRRCGIACWKRPASVPKPAWPVRPHGFAATRPIRVCCSRCATTSSAPGWANRSEEHTSELQSRENLVCRLLLEKKKE